MLERRNIALCIVLSIVTCGIYGLYWLAVMNDDMNRLTREPQPTSGGMVVLLTIVTCGIYGIYWSYKMGEKLDRIDAANGQPNNNRAILYLLLSIFGLSIITYALIQDTLNQFAPAPAAPQQPYGQPYQQPYQGQQQAPYQQPYQQPYQAQQSYQQPAPPQEPAPQEPPQDPQA